MFCDSCYHRSGWFDIANIYVTQKPSASDSVPLLDTKNGEDRAGCGNEYIGND